MSRFWLTVSLPLILCVGACGQDPLKVTGTQEVDIPIPIRCNVPTVTPPVLVFDTQAKSTDTIFRKAQLLAAQDYNLKVYSNKLAAALNVCATAPVPAIPASPEVSVK